MPEPSVRAREQAHGLLLTLALLAQAVRDGGQQFSEVHLDAVLDDLLRLLQELGGFEGVVCEYQEYLGKQREPRQPNEATAQAGGHTKLALLVLQEALKYADQNDPPLLEYVYDLYRFAMKMLRRFGLIRHEKDTGEGDRACR